jgi:hypothetical protein
MEFLWAVAAMGVEWLLAASPFVKRDSGTD